MIKVQCLIVIATISIVFLLPNVLFAQKEDNWEEQFFKKLREPAGKTNIKKFSQEIDRTQEDELVRLMKYQAEAKKPGMAALLGGIMGLGLGHYYVSGNWVQFYCIGEIISLTMIVIGANVKEPIYEYNWVTAEEKVGEEITAGGYVIMFGGVVGFAILRIIEPFRAYSKAVQYNQRLLDKYDINLSLSNMDRGFRLTYRF